jgi:hypothetical protein
MYTVTALSISPSIRMMPASGRCTKASSPKHSPAKPNAILLTLAMYISENSNGL